MLKLTGYIEAEGFSHSTVEANNGTDMRLNVVLTQIVSKHNNMAATVMNEIEARSDPLNE